MTHGVLPLDDPVGVDVGRGGGDRVRDAELLHPDAESRAGGELFRTLDRRVPHRPRTVQFGMTMRVGDESEDLGSRRVDDDAP